MYICKNLHVFVCVHFARVCVLVLSFFACTCVRLQAWRRSVQQSLKLTTIAARLVVRWKRVNVSISMSLYANCVCIYTENMPISMKMCQFLCVKLCLFLCLYMLIARAYVLKFVSENALHERGLLHKAYKN